MNHSYLKKQVLSRPSKHFPKKKDIVNIFLTIEEYVQVSNVLAEGKHELKSWIETRRHLKEKFSTLG